MSGMYSNIVANIIRVLHFLLVVFIIGAPFFGGPHLLTYHFIIVPFILLHWLTNQSVCALTEMEKMLRGTDCDEETFFGQLVGPVYKFKTQREENLFVWTLMGTLWMVSAFRLHNTGFAQLKSELAFVLAKLRRAT
jgi:hypothetical protein